MPIGSICVNNEDFNGTVFGKFQCPLPEIDSSATYCCGSAEEETQYCCTFMDEYAFRFFCTTSRPIFILIK